MLLLGLAVISESCVGCPAGGCPATGADPGPVAGARATEAREPPLPRELHAGERLFQPRVDGDRTSSRRMMTALDIAGWARSFARIEGWGQPCDGAFVLGAGTAHEKRVPIAPLTEESIRTSGVRIEEIDWVVVTGRR